MNGFVLTLYSTLLSLGSGTMVPGWYVGTIEEVVLRE